LRVLGLLPQLESLSLWLANRESHGLYTFWSDKAMRTLGNLPLHLLRLALSCGVG
jgi:hypothetical protein